MTEEDSFDLDLPDKLREMLASIRHVEDAASTAVLVAMAAADTVTTT
jgi:hypothetical protein